MIYMIHFSISFFEEATSPLIPSKVIEKHPGKLENYGNYEVKM